MFSHSSKPIAANGALRPAKKYLKRKKFRQKLRESLIDSNLASFTMIEILTTISRRPHSGAFFVLEVDYL